MLLGLANYAIAKLSGSSERQLSTQKWSLSGTEDAPLSSAKDTNF
ncbi:MAG: hypothetical protein ACTHJR_17795 [Sphingomonas sp.]